MTPSQTFDPRDQWAKARRIEVFRYATELGHTKDDYIQEQMPKDMMVKRLKARNVPPPSVPPRPIGAHISARSGDTSPDSHHYNAAKPATSESVSVDAADILERDWKPDLPTADAPTTDLAKMSIGELRQACKTRGIKLARTDNMVSMREKLNGQ